MRSITHTFHYVIEVLVVFVKQINDELAVRRHEEIQFYECRILVYSVASGEHMSTYTIPSVVTDAIKVRHNGGWGVLVKTAGIYAVQICHQKNKKYIIHQLTLAIH